MDRGDVKDRSPGRAGSAPFVSATAMAALVRSRTRSSVEIVDACLERIERVGTRLNCFVEVFADEARLAAQRADQAVESGVPLGPLHGVPIALKDMTAIAGHVTTYGCSAMRGHVAQASEPLVERLVAAGAIIVGKTATPAFGASCFTSSRITGDTRNPWALDRTPGGSSGGSAAAVASGCVALAEGSDMGGSIRIPAAFTGLVGLKPSFGRIPSTMLGTIFDGLFHFGPLARTVADAALFLRATEGPDARDISSLPARSAALALPEADVRGLAIGLVTEVGDCAVEPAIERNAAAAAAVLEAAGARIRPVALPWGEAEVEAWMTHAGAWYATFVAPLLAGAAHVEPLVAAFIERGRRTSAVDLKRTEAVRARMWADLQPLLETFDALLCPTTTVVAPKLTAGDGDYYTRRADGRFQPLDLALFFNLLGACPVLAVPSGLSPDGLPTGIQIIGRRFDEAMTLGIGAVLEAEIGWVDWQPPFADGAGQ